MRKSPISWLIASAFLAPSFILSAQAEDLMHVYKQALAYDATYASARSSLTASKERVPQAKSQLLPNIAINANQTNAQTRFSPGNEGQIGLSPTGGLAVITGQNTTDHTTAYSLVLSQPLFRWDRWQTFEQSKLAAAIGEAQFAQAGQDLILRVAQAYFDLLAAQDVIESILAQKKATTEQLASAKLQYKVGTQIITDTYDAQAAYDLVVSQEISAQNDLENKRTALQAMIGNSPASVATLPSSVRLSAPQPAQIESWVSSAENQNYNVISAQFALESAQREIKKSRSGHLPTLDLVSSVSNTSTQNTIRSKSIGINLTIPLYSGDGTSSRIRENLALEEKAKNDVDFTRRAAVQTARQAFLGVNSGIAQVAALEAAEISGQSSFDSNKLGYEVGVRINLDVLNAQRLLFSTRANLAKARYDTIMNGLRLKAAAGTLKEADLVQVNSLLRN
ncbi:MAG: TolC family outer membrane protein [Undibacterium sp.]|nr:TolC family outer membrane protein [Undibacterium sp.]